MFRKNKKLQLTLVCNKYQFFSKQKIVTFTTRILKSRLNPMILSLTKQSAIVKK